MQRRIKRGKAQGSRPLSQTQIDKLNTIPGFFDDLDTLWNDSFEKVKQYYEENGVLPSSCDRDSAMKTLGLWCSRQRRIERGKMRGRRPLSQEQIDKLNTIQGWWW